MIPLGRRNSPYCYDRTTMDEAAAFLSAQEQDEQHDGQQQQQQNVAADKTQPSRRITDTTACSSVVPFLDFEESSDSEDDDDSCTAAGASASVRKFVSWADDASTVRTIPHLDDQLSSDASAPLSRHDLWYSADALDRTLAECMAAVDAQCMDQESATNDRRGLEFMTPHGLDISRHSRSIVLRVLEQQTLLRKQQQQFAALGMAVPVSADDIATALADVYIMSSAHRQRVAHLMGMRDANEVRQMQAAEQDAQPQVSAYFVRPTPSQRRSNPWAQTASASSAAPSNPWANASTQPSVQSLLQAGAQERQRRRSLRSTNGGRFRQRHSHSGTLQSNIQQAWSEISASVTIDSSDDEDAPAVCEPVVAAPMPARRPNMPIMNRRSSYTRRTVLSRRRCSVEAPAN